MKVPELILHPELRGKVKLAYFTLSGAECEKFNPQLWEEIEALCEQRQRQFSKPGDALAYLKPARTLYYRIGMEPTRIRPSSEALFRRVIKGKGLYQINSLVDAGNYCSLFFWLPIGLYDLDKVQGKIEIRFGKTKEGYEGIGKERINLENRLTLADEKGPFGNPSSDSRRTSIQLFTQNILMVIFAPGDYVQEKLADLLNTATEFFKKHHPTSQLTSKSFLY